MLDPRPITVTLSPNECWLPTLKQVVTDYCVAAEFPQPLVDRVVAATEEVCAELVKRCLSHDIDEQFTLRLSLQEEACVVEVIYNKDVFLDPTRSEDSENREHQGERIAMDSLWLHLVKEKMDRVFFRYEADRRVLEMRLYRRSEGKVGQYWLMGLKSQLKEDVKIDIERDEKGDPVSSVLHDLKSGKVLLLNGGGTFVIERLDGAHTFYEIYMEYIDKISLTSPEHLAMIFTSLENAGMLASHDQEVKHRGFLGKLSDISSKFAFRSLNLPHADSMVNGLYKRVHRVFRPGAMLLVVLFAFSGFIPMSHEVTEIHHFISKPALAIHNNPLILIELYVMMTLVAVMHEFAHALTCKHFGGSVHRIGFMFYLAMFIFFADVSAAWAFRSKWRRIGVAVAGPLLNLVMMSISFWIWHFHKAHVPPEHSIWFLMGFFCFYSTVLNTIPFIKMDGYYVLTDLTGISTLREKSFAFLGRKLADLFGIESEGEKSEPKGREKWILWGYGIIGSAFTALFIAYPIFEFVRYVSTEHPSKRMAIFFGVIVALMLYNAAYRAYQMAHSRLHREIVIA